MDFVVKGTVTQVLPMQEGVSQRTGTPWQRQSVIIEHESGQYPKSIVVDINGIDRINKFALAVGKYVTAHLAISAREYNGRWYNTIEIWKVDGGQQQGQRQAPAQGQQAPAPQPAPAPQAPPQQPAAPQGGNTQGADPFPPQGNDGLPFD